MMPGAPVVIVLAAGRGSRFLASGGSCHKLQADLQGKPVLDHVLAAVARSGLAVHVVRHAAGDGMATRLPKACALPQVQPAGWCCPGICRW